MAVISPAARASLETGDLINTGLALLQAAAFAGRRGDAVRAATLLGAGDTHLVTQKAKSKTHSILSRSTELY